MNKIKSNFKVALLLSWMLIPCAVMAQGTAPMWLDADVRSAQYPAETHYTGFGEVSVGAGEGQEKALNRAKQAAVGELSERVRVMVSSEKSSLDISLSGSDIEEQIRSKFETAVKTASQTEVVGSKVNTYYDAARKTAYAFAYVSRAELIAYYQKQITLYLNKVESALKIASELAEKGAKVKARKQCEEVIKHFATVAYSQDLLTAVDVQADDAALQQSRSERLRNELVQTLTDLENSIYVYVECKEIVDGEEVEYIADKLPGLLTDNDCGCNFTTDADQADYVIKVNAYIARCTDAGGGQVFCYADATVNLYNAHTQKTLKPKIPEAKGGWTGKNYVKAGEEAFDELAKKIVEQVIPMMKN
jgi:transcriptional regulator NrdR family protein